MTLCIKIEVYRIYYIAWSKALALFTFISAASFPSSIKPSKFNKVRLLSLLFYFRACLNLRVPGTGKKNFPTFLVMEESVGVPGVDGYGEIFLAAP